MRSRTIALTAIVVLLLAGCGGGSSTPAADLPADATSSAGGEGTVATADPETPAVPPATGRRVIADGVSEPGLTYRLPEGRWVGGGTELATRYDRFGQTAISHGALAYGDVSLTRLANLALGLYDWPRSAEIERTADRTVAGSDWYVIEAKDRERGFEYRLGTVRDADNSHELVFSFPKETAEARQMIESVLATVAWR
ncbi:hypothetical protein [Nocardioides sambongensis]|uniref:hypothetical protein n=1 Tax=Nocardioides sambongensis TaxID=2589074 RepID=UPI00112C9675|nr:hypothetical protein [Nocardioides sambongensis]